jgi:hypothetical protein
VPRFNGHKYLRVVEAYRENGKVKQRIIAELGRRDMLSALLPNLRRILEGTPKLEGQGDNEVDILGGGAEAQSRLPLAQREPQRPSGSSSDTTRDYSPLSLPSSSP